MEKVIKAQIKLLSPTKATMLPIQIQYNNDENEPYPLSEISLVYNGIEYKGTGTDYLWQDTFADLQKKLPHNVKLACCMTCRHGNMCPYGNIENELFCTKERVIRNKSDMCELFDNNNVLEPSVVCSYGFCDDFIYQTNDYFTYNDYLYWLTEMK